MLAIREFINKLSKLQKVAYLISLCLFVLLLVISIPTLARFKNRTTLVNAPVWNGSIATDYKKGTGTENDPYIISNGSELAYFYTQLENNDYNDKYFALSNDIVLNDGIFNYNPTDGIKYILNEQTYYIGNYTNKYYETIERTGTESGTINIFNSLDDFKGIFDGRSFTIYGLYLTDNDNEELALFTNLQGNVKDLYVENSMVYGGIYTGGIAAVTNNASLKNVLFDGYVVGKSTEITKNINTIPTSSVINLQSTPKTDYINLTNDIPFVGSEIVSTSITGNYVISGASQGETSIEINGTPVTNGSFNINLGTNILNSLSVVTSTTSLNDVTLTFSNLSYNITYKYAVAGGLVAKCNNTSIENSVNKGRIYAFSTVGGLIGVTTNMISINQSYNTGLITSQYVSGGLVGTIEKSSSNITILKSYNSGDMASSEIGGLIGYISNNSGNISLNNVFNTSTTNYSIGTVNNTSVNVSNGYFVNGIVAVHNGTVNGNFSKTTLDNLMIKNYAISNLLFNEFIDFENLSTSSQNVWVYENNSLPILFIDDISKPVANIHVGVYSWNNLSYELNPVKFGSNISFSIEETDELVPLREKYYYISNSKIPLTETEISEITSWNTYNNIVQVTTEGFYVIYIKVVDYNDNVTYINTDLLVLDLSGSSVSAALDNNTWTNLRSSLNDVYINKQKTITVTATDNLSGIESIKYYITSDVLNTSDLNALNASSWNNYTSGITISDIGKYIVYIKVVDNCNYITYINTDYIVYNGYTENNLIIGRNATSYSNADPYITNKSTLTLNVTYNNSSSELSNHSHNLISNILLPMGTKITLFDNINNKVYEYKINTLEDIYNYNNSCNPEDLDCQKIATYPLTLFKEVGTGSTNKLYSENTYYNNGMVSESFTIVLDLSAINISTNYSDVSLYMELHDQSGNNVRPTLDSTIKKFNIYSNIDSVNTSANLSLTTNYSGDSIQYNSDSSTDINITSGLVYKYLNQYKVIDTTYENKTIGLAIKLVDETSSLVDKLHLKSMMFKIGDEIYYPENDNVVRIDLENGLTDINKTITVVTKLGNASLEEGTYYLKISNYASYDGGYYDILNNTELSIPVNVSNSNSNITHSFNVLMDDTNRIISKNSSTVKVAFNLLQSGSLKNPNIKVSLYKKDQLTAYNQTYSIVDLENYVSDNLNKYANNIYYVSTNPIKYNGKTSSYNYFELNLITANFENNGYKYVFELYDGTKKIGTINKHFIVK